MKTSENQPNVSTTQDAATTSANLNDSVISQTQSEPSSTQHDAQSLNQPPSAVEHFKKPHLKLFNNLMKPSLSLNCLPPNSPKEVTDEATLVERPYNSLKVERFRRKLHETSLKFLKLADSAEIHKYSCIKYFLEKARWRKRTLAAFLGIAGVHQHYDIAHRHQQEWQRLLVGVQLHHGHKSHRLMSWGDRRGQQSR